MWFFKAAKVPLFLYRFFKAVRFLYSLLYLTQEGMSRPLRPCVIFVEYGHTCHIVAVCRVIERKTNFYLFCLKIFIHLYANNCFMENKTFFNALKCLSLAFLGLGLLLFIIFILLFIGSLVMPFVLYT